LNEDRANRLALENFIQTRAEPPIQGIAENEEQRKEALSRASDLQNSNEEKDKLFKDGLKVIGK